MNVNREQLVRDAAQFEKLKNSASQLAELERQEQAEAQAQELDDRICDLSAKLFNDCSNFQRLKEENDKKLLSLLWSVRSVISDRIRLAESTAEIVNVSRHLAHQRLIKNGNLPPDMMGQKIEIDMLSEQILIDEYGSANLMDIADQDDQIVNALLGTASRFTNDRIISKPTRQPLAKNADGVLVVAG